MTRSRPLALWLLAAAALAVPAHAQTSADLAAFKADYKRPPAKPVANLTWLSSGGCCSGIRARRPPGPRPA